MQTMRSRLSGVESLEMEAEMVRYGNGPEVGELCKNGKPWFYVTINGEIVQRKTRFEIGSLIWQAKQNGKKVGA